MTFESIVRYWCHTYHEMLDSKTNGNRRFWFTDTRENMVEMAKNWKPTMSPCVVMECVEEGGGPIRRPSMNYPIYFCVRAIKMSDGDAAVIAVKEAKRHMDKFLAWIIDKHDRQLDNGDRDGDFARIDLDDSYIDITTIGPFGDGWYAVLLQMVREEPLNLCVSPEDYDEDENEPLPI